MSEVATAKSIAAAARISPATKRFTLHDEFNLTLQGQRYELVLAALSRSDLTPTLSTRVHTVAYALRKCMVTARMAPGSRNRIAAYTPYQLCALVARIVNDCPATTIGGICDEWLASHHTEL